MFYGLPQIHKPDTPLRPIVSSSRSVTYGVAKELAKNLKPLVGKSSHHINSIQDFLEQVKQLTLAHGECISSYDVSALFTSVPVDPALGVIKDLLEKDPTLKDITVLTVNDIIQLLEFCLKNMYFSFQDQFYEQIEGVAMGSPVSPIVASLYMEYFEQKALSTAPTPRLWWRYVDDTFVIQKKSTNRTSYNTLTVLTLPSSLQWRTTRRIVSSPSWTPLLHQRLMGVCPLLCTGNLPTKTSFLVGSHHHLSAKFSVINTLTHRAKTVCSNPELLHKEMDHLRKALT